MRISDWSSDVCSSDLALSVVAVIYISLVALVQQDMKKLIAYSSVAHMGFVTIGMFTLTTQGVEGSIFQMLSHGIVSGELRSDERRVGKECDSTCRSRGSPDT